MMMSTQPCVHVFDVDVRIECDDHMGHVRIAGEPTEALLRLQKRRRNPAVFPPRRAPAFDVTHDLACTSIRRLDTVGRAKVFPQRRRQLQSMKGQGFFEALLQAPRRRVTDSFLLPHNRQQGAACLVVRSLSVDNTEFRSKWSCRCDGRYDITLRRLCT
jgi:hypothetical protein